MAKSKVVYTLVALFFCITLSLDALAEDERDEWAGPEPEDMYDPVEFTGLTGDWNGQRKDLADNGITLDMDVVQTYQGVLDGGTDSTWKYGGVAEINMQLDFQKLGLWPGAFVNARATHQFGRFVNADTGMASSANTIGLWPLPDYDGVALSQFVLTQFLSESCGIFLGKIDTTDGDGTRFSGARGKDNFMNANFVFNPVPARVAPLSALGGGVFFILPDVHTERPTSLGFSVLGTDGMPNTVGWDDDFEDGTSFLADLKVPTNFLGKEGSHSFAVGYTTKDYAPLDSDPRWMLPESPVPLEEKDDTWAFMYNFDQYLYTEAEDKTQGFGLFGRYGLADDETAPSESFYSIGLGGKGIIEDRDEDTFGIGYFYLALSDKIPNLILNNFDDSQGFEFFYNIEINPWLHITPDLQILEPSNESVDTTYVAGVRLKMDF